MGNSIASQTAARKTTRNGSPRSLDKVPIHRARLRTQGMRPITIWVSDIRSPQFAEEARRQCLLANSGAHPAGDRAWADEMAEGNGD